MPAAFLAHGSPMQAVERDDFTAELRRWAERIPKPRAVVVVSAHWESRGAVRVTGSAKPPLIYDFSGFPPELYDVRYPSPGDPALAREVASLLHAEIEPSRGLDHGAWVPLYHAFPAADAPVVEVSLPESRTSDDVARMGRALAPLRERGVLLVGSGGIVHNLRRVRLDDKTAPVEPWAEEFDRWVAARVESLDLDGLASYRPNAPHAELSVPTPEHFDPVFFVLGAALPGDRVLPIHAGFQYGSLSMRSFALSA